MKTSRAARHKMTGIRLPRALRAGPQRGRTLIELLIAMVLSLMIIGAVGVLYSVSSNTSRTAQELGGAEERGQLAMFFMGEPITLASYGTINSAEFTRSRFAATAFQAPHLRACTNGRFADPFAGDFTCVPTATPGDPPGDQLYIGYMAEGAPAQGISGVTDCQGNGPVGNQIADVFSIEKAGSGTFEFGCDSAAGTPFTALVRNAVDFKVYFALSTNSLAMVEAGGAPHTFKPSALLTADQINALPGANDDPTSAGNPWNHVVAVYACVLVEASQAGTTADGASTFQPCPQDENAAATGTPTTTVADGIARRSYTQVYTIRSRAQARAGSQAQM